MWTDFWFFWGVFWAFWKFIFILKISLIYLDLNGKVTFKFLYKLDIISTNLKALLVSIHKFIRDYHQYTMLGKCPNKGIVKNIYFINIKVFIYS